MQPLPPDPPGLPGRRGLTRTLSQGEGSLWQVTYNLPILQTFQLVSPSRVLLLSVAHVVRATSPHRGEWRRLVKDKTHSAPGNGCCGSSMNLTGSLLFVGLRLVGTVSAGGIVSGNIIR